VRSSRRETALAAGLDISVYPLDALSIQQILETLHFLVSDPFRTMTAKEWAVTSPSGETENRRSGASAVPTASGAWQRSQYTA
jgi:hypothetical protein